MKISRSFVAVAVLVGCLILFEAVAPVRRAVEPAERLAASAGAWMYGRTEPLRTIAGRVFGTGGDNEAALRSTVSLLEFDHTELEKLRDENKTLRDTIALKEHQAWNLVATRVIGSDPLRRTDGIVLAAGRVDGVVSGAAVVDAHGLLLGVIDRVGDATSTMRVMHARGVKVPARVVGREAMVGLLESTDGLSLTLEELPKSGDLRVGDVVVTGIEDAAIQPGIPIGTVISMKGGPEDLWRQATIGPFGSVASLSIVSIVIPRPYAP